MKRLILTLALAGVASVLQPMDAYAAELITLKESKLPDAAGAIATRGISRGPGIKVVSPAPGAATPAPFEFKLEFTPRSGAPIDLSSIKVVYMKNPMVDLTPRVKSSITPDGIDFKNAQVPTGDHQIKVVVADTDGREATAFVNISVVK